MRTGEIVDNKMDAQTEAAEAGSVQRVVRANDSAERWIKGEISIGKMLHSYGCGRPSGDDLAGALANYFQENIRQVMRDLEAHATRHQLQFQKEEAAGDKTNMAAEAALVHAYTVAQSLLRLHLGHSL